MSVSAVGPSGIKADYSNYGVTEITVPRPVATSATSSARSCTAARSTRSGRRTRRRGRGHRRDHQGRRRPEQRVRHPLVHEGRRVRLLPGHPGHLHGFTACDRGRRLIIGALGGDADPALVQPDPGAERGRPRVPRSGNRRLHDRRPSRLVERHVHRHARRSTTSTGTASSTPPLPSTRLAAHRSRSGRRP